MIGSHSAPSGGSSISARSYTAFIPGRLSVGPGGRGGMNALNSTRWAAQSAGVRKPPGAIPPPNARWPAAGSAG